MSATYSVCADEDLVLRHLRHAGRVPVQTGGVIGNRDIGLTHGDAARTDADLQELERRDARTLSAEIRHKLRKGTGGTETRHQDENGHPACRHGRSRDGSRDD